MKPEQRMTLKDFLDAKDVFAFHIGGEAVERQSIKRGFLPPEISSWDLFDGKVQRQSDREDVGIERWRQGMLEE